MEKKLIIEGNSVYEIDEECLKRLNEKENEEKENKNEEIHRTGKNTLENKSTNYKRRRGLFW